MKIRVCFVGDDVRPPWNHASSILTKRLIECLSPQIDCSLATVSPDSTGNGGLTGVEKVMIAKSTGNQSRDAVKLSFLARGEPADILHLVGTNALVFSPLSRILGQRGRIVRHLFTPYDAKDRIVRPVRWLANRFIDGYAFTTPWIGPWDRELSSKRRFLLRPPINCDLYRPADGFGSNLGANGKNYTLLYMGPLLPSRFPYPLVLKALQSLKTKRSKARLVVLTSATRSTDEQCEKVLDSSRELSVEDNLVLKRVDLSEDERIRWYNSADVIIFPFVGPQPEKLADPPFGILEAMSCGRVVLASDVLSVPEVVEDAVTGFLFSKMTPEELEAGLLRALESSDREKIARNARARILEKFDYAKIREDALNLYSSILN